jgi:hypothetical protein
MEKLLEKLETVLQSEVNVHTTMIDSSKKINMALRTGDIETVDRQRIAHDEAVCRIEHLETERVDCCTTAADVLGIVKKPLRLSMLFEKIPEEWKWRLEKVQCTLKTRIKELIKLNISNRILLEEGLNVIGNTFSMFQKAGKKYAGYGKLGQTMAPSAPRSIINRIV